MKHNSKCSVSSRLHCLKLCETARASRGGVGAISVCASGTRSRSTRNHAKRMIPVAGSLTTVSHAMLIVGNGAVRGVRRSNCMVLHTAVYVAYWSGRTWRSQPLAWARTHEEPAATRPGATSIKTNNERLVIFSHSLLVGVSSRRLIVASVVRTRSSSSTGSSSCQLICTGASSCQLK